ncbi:hypothetical protein BC477_04435 [Clavibacter michiganensis subsp. michiganensis]|uniref:N-acetyltransferase domain-containing protein n=2 Tax=Clavibacter michiganensis TaxID=28447 RepID=A0A251XKN9_CLAMM|nr:hypothetical protein BC477_04435 [Clavibacter michiganensis subsp. michiganensis]OUE03960.1 hypothetical protein CMMCAS07_03365 [Clavibacter michiganensis subsp. michiganensis]
MGSEVQVGSAGHVALLESRGFTPSRYFIEMHRDLQTELPDVPAPEGLRLIPVTREWWERTRLAKNEVFRDHWGSEPVSVERWDAYRSLPTARDDLSVIAVTGEGEDAVVAGFAMAETYPDSWEAAGYTSTYIALVGVRREFRGRRLAQAILSASLAGPARRASSAPCSTSTPTAPPARSTCTSTSASRRRAARPCTSARSA